MTHWKRVLVVLIVAVTTISLVLSACGPIDIRIGDSEDGKDKNKDKDDDKGNGQDKEGKLTICHKTGSAKNPYVEITVSDAAVAGGHASHEGDIIPAPEDGCPTE